MSVTPRRHAGSTPRLQHDRAVLSAVRKALDPWLGNARYKAGEGRATLHYRFIAEGADAVPMRLKIEINTREHFAVLPRRRVPFAIDSAWCRGSADIPTYATEELLGTKLRALDQRRKGRDVTPLLALGSADRSGAEALDLVLDELVARHSGEPWAGGAR